MRRIRWWILCGVMFGQLAVAEEPTITEVVWLEEFPETLLSTRLAQTIADAPGAIAVIDRQMIEAAGVREIQDLLRLAPGMLVHHDNGHRATVTYRALADTYSKRILVLIDGRTAYTPIISAVNWTMLPITVDDIERVEIFRGPNAAAFGANAFLGVISIITRRPHLSRGTTVAVTRGNNGIYRGLTTMGGQRDDLDWRVTLQTSGDHGYNGNILDDDDKHTTLLSMRADWRDAQGGIWQWHGGFARGRREHGGTNQLLRPPHEIRSRGGYAQLDWRSSDDADDYHAVRAYWTLDSWSQDYLTRPVPALGGLQGRWWLSVRGSRYEVEYSRSLTPTETLRSSWGVSARLDRMGAPGYLGRPDTLENDSYRAFSHHEWRITPLLAANLGVMLERDGYSGAEVSPRVALNWSFAEGQMVRVSYGTATRTPTIVEENADSVLDFGLIQDQMLLASGGLRAERIRSTEIGWILRSAEHGLVLDARISRDRIDRLITYYFVPFPDLDGMTQDFRNFDAMRMRGFEMQASWRPVVATRVVLNYSYTEIEATDIDERYSVSGPRHIWSLYGEWAFTPNTQGSFVLHHIGAMQGMNTGMWIERQRRLDLKVSHAFRLGSIPARVSLVVQEPIGDLRDFRIRNEFHRRWFVDLNLRF